MPPTRLLSALDNGTAWRGGATWAGTHATGSAKVTAVQSLRAVDGTTVELLALDEVDCTAICEDFVGAAGYAQDRVQLGATWYVDPVDRSTVHTVSGNVVAACESVVRLAAVAREVKPADILRADQTVFRTTTSGQTWSQSVSVPAAVNLGVTTMGYVIATVGLPECAGVQLIALSDQAPSPSSTGCLQVATPSETLPGNVAVSDAAGTLWVWVGDEVKRSLDEGAAWE